MSSKVLKVVSDGMTELGIEYGFGTYSGNPIVYPYFVGEYSESEPINEDGMQESTFILNGFSRDTWMELETAKESIESYFSQISGKIVVANDGSAVAVFYASALIIPTGDAELKRVQINLSVKEWKVN